jgi:hypothetical protein
LSFIGTRLPSPFCHSPGVSFIPFSFFFSPLPSPLFLYFSFALASLFPPSFLFLPPFSSTSPSPFLLYFLVLSSSFPPYSSFTLPHSLIPHLFSLSLTLYPSSLPHSPFLLPLAPPYIPLVSPSSSAGPIRAALSNGVIPADERVHIFSDMFGVHWHNDLISLAFVSIVVESHWKCLWRHPCFCFSHHPS